VLNNFSIEARSVKIFYSEAGEFKLVRDKKTMAQVLLKSLC